MGVATGTVSRVKTVLIVEDDEGIRDAIEYWLEARGYRVVLAGDGATALQERRANRVDLIILDLSLPVIDGRQVCKALRSDGDTVPIIMLTAWHTERDKIEGLKSGADDYITKPFGMKELLARVDAQIRRFDMLTRDVADARSESAHVITVEEFEIDLVKRRVLTGGYDLGLRNKEFDLLVHLASSPGRVFTRSQLLKAVWDDDGPGGSRTIDVHMSLLRRKLEDDPSNPQKLQTVRGVGYRFTP